MTTEDGLSCLRIVRMGALIRLCQTLKYPGDYGDYFLHSSHRGRLLRRHLNDRPIDIGKVAGIYVYSHRVEVVGPLSSHEQALLSIIRRMV